MNSNATKNSPYRPFLARISLCSQVIFFLEKFPQNSILFSNKAVVAKATQCFGYCFFFLFFDPRTVYKWKILGYTEILAVSIPRQDCGAQHILLKARSEPSYNPFCCCKTRCERLLLCLCYHGDCNADLYLIFKKNKFWYRQQLLGGETFFFKEKTSALSNEILYSLLKLEMFF